MAGNPVIRGELRFKKVPPPAAFKGHSRMTPQRVKEAAFQLIENFHPYFGDVIFWDIYAGSGQMGIEALSRGAAYCVFCESHQKRLKAIQSWLRDNNITQRTAFHRLDGARAAQKASQTLPTRMPTDRAYEDTEQLPFSLVIFADPPYSLIDANPYAKILHSFKQSSRFESAILIVQAPHNKRAGQPKILRHEGDDGTLLFDRQYPYGNTQLLVATA